MIPGRSEVLLSVQAHPLPAIAQRQGPADRAAFFRQLGVDAQLQVEILVQAILHTGPEHGGIFRHLDIAALEADPGQFGQMAGDVALGPEFVLPAGAEEGLDPAAVLRLRSLWHEGHSRSGAVHGYHAGGDDHRVRR